MTFTGKALLFGVEVLDLATEAEFRDNTPVEGDGSCLDVGGVLIGIVNGIIRVLPLPTGSSTTIETFGNGNGWTTLAR